MEGPNVDVDEKQLVVRRLTEIINIFLVSLVGCNFDEVHGFNRYGSNHNFGDCCREPGSV